MVPRNSPPGAGSGPILARSSGPPAASSRRSSHLQVKTFMRFIPLASDTSIGAMEPRKSEGMNEETRDMRAVARYASGLMRRICAGGMIVSESVSQAFGWYRCAQIER